MPNYLLLLRDDGFTEAPPTQEMFNRFVAWADALHRQGRLLGVDRLAEDGGRTVRKRGGRVLVDGPFAEGKEAVLGYFLVSASSYEEAVEIAAQCPGLGGGCDVEVRQVGEFPKPR